MEKLEEEKTTLLAFMDGGSTDAQKLTEVATRYAEVMEQLEDMEMRWLELSELF